MPAQSPRSMRGLFVRSVAGPQSYALTQPDELVASSSPTPNVLVVSPPFTAVPVPGARITSSQPLGNPAVATPGPLVVSTQPAAPVTRAATFAAPQQTSTAAPLVVGPEFCWPLIPPVLLGASQPLGTPAVGTTSALVVSPGPATPAVLPAQIFQAPQAAVVVTATATPTALVVTPPQQSVPVPAARLFASPGQSAAPAPLVVGPAFTWPATPPVSVTASQPLGNPATPTPQLLVVTPDPPAPVVYPPWQSANPPPPPPIVTGSTPAPLVVGPDFVWPLIPTTYLTASQPLGNPAVSSPQPLVVTPAQSPPAAPRPFLAAGSATTATGQLLLVNAVATPTPILAIRIFAAPPSAPIVPSTPTAGPLVIGPPWRPVAIPKTYTSANYPLGNPAVSTPQPLVVTPPQRWPTWTASLITATPVLAMSCTTPQPDSGTTTRPGSGTTAYALATTARPGTGITLRPNTGITEDPC